ncbi:MAG: hypothetical protein KKH94_01680 [Candidatus Omnitrophica bacterium]|nr:hypothetical protein [Candidatus Omnitrophota bacterium]
MKLRRFKIKPKISRFEMELKIACAIRETEGMFGKAKVRLHAAYVAANGRIVIDIFDPVGEYIATKLTEMLIKDYGENSFTIERVEYESYPRI